MSINFHYFYQQKFSLFLSTDLSYTGDKKHPLLVPAKPKGDAFK
ncbi:hypothetical protein BRYFOR_08025 [Marvinbryantia formatexigens DSM 14469]|uniref:Uncharacterized protein n=1 Tax=Marvinbryantia formatexigens DSM 14469 TaxID=478749 RepID=C6LHB4_9FIRM|nr:hypothetical protein BRYFOR_08025 [Marvinbryantia formatexigens DSM 14469]